MKYGLIGRSLIHSFSKEIHEELGKYKYHLFSLAADEVAGFITAYDFGGLNVTIPYKQDVIPLCDEISDLAREIGAVNTLYQNNGKLIGHNTDYEGFLYTAGRAKISFANKTVLILGSGGTSMMVRKAVSDLGAVKVLIASRSGNGPVQHGNKFTTISYSNLLQISGTVDIIINTTPVGTFPNNMESIISLKDFHGCQGVIDVIYNPFKTALLLEAEKLGLKFSNGLPMLVAQATAAAGYFLGTPGAFESENERIINKLDVHMRNFVLIGMPGCGKTTLGKLLAEKTGKHFVDMDNEIIKDARTTIPKIFANEGEEGFRDRETKIAAALGKEHGQVIATGGGALLRPQNVLALKQNAILIHVTRPLENLSTSGRPLSTTLTALKEMAEIRLPIYEAAADVSFDNSKDLTKDALANVFCSSFKQFL